MDTRFFPKILNLVYRPLSQEIQIDSVDRRVSNKIANGSFLCSFLVLCIHAAPKHLGVCYSILAHGIAKIAVPFFFLASGYFLAGHIRECGWYRKEVVKRINSLLFPLIAWDILFYFWKSTVCFHGFKMRLVEILKILAIHPFAQPYLGILWFLRALFILVLFSPVLIRFARPLPILFAWVLQGVLYPDYGERFSALSFTLCEGFLPLFGAIYFMGGMMMRLHCPSLVVPKKVGWIALLFSIFLIVLRGDPYESRATRMITWFYIPFLITGVWTILPEKNLPELFSKAAFPVYALHLFFVEWLTVRGCFELTPAKWLVLVFAIFLFCIVVASLSRKMLPKTAYFLFGGR